MTCDQAKVLMGDAWNLSLAEGQDLEFEAHLASCASCREETERLGMFWKSLGLLPAEEPSAAMRGRFLEKLGVYRQGLESAPRIRFRDKLLSFWPKEPAWQVALSAALLVAGLVTGYEIRPSKAPQAVPEVAQLRGEVDNMRQLVALSLLQQQSAGERLRGVSWAYQAAPSDDAVLTALLTAVNDDPSVNVRLAAVDALHAFGASNSMRRAILQSLPRQTTPLVQIALIDLLVDLKDKDAAPDLQKLGTDQKINDEVRQHAHWALERL